MKQEKQKIRAAIYTRKSTEEGLDKEFNTLDAQRISLKTRCPKEALRLAKALEYHSVNLIKELNLDHMNNDEILEIVKAHYAAQLDVAKQMMDTVSVTLKC